MLHRKQNLENPTKTKKIRKSPKSSAVGKPSFLNKLPNLAISQLDPIKSPFFLNFFHYPASIKTNILRINHKPQVSDLDLLVKDLAFAHEFIDLCEMQQLVLEQEKLISSTMSSKSSIDERPIEKHAIESSPEETLADISQKSHERSPINNSKRIDLIVKVKEESEHDLSKTCSKKEISFYESSLSTTPTKKGSPLFNEKKNLLLSSRIENILSDNYEMMVKKFDEESLNLESLEEEEQEKQGKMFCEGMWEDHENKAEKEAYFFKGLEMDRSLFANDKDFFNFF